MGAPRELLKSSLSAKYRPRGNLSLKAEGLLHKADTALSPAQLLLASGDADGACKRAYYSMFDAARTALMAFQNSDEVFTIKTHSGLRTSASFSIQLVKSGLINIGLGKAVNKVEDLRLIADYKGDAITLTDAVWAVDQAATFLATIQSTFFRGQK